MASGGLSEVDAEADQLEDVLRKQDRVYDQAAKRATVSQGRFQRLKKCDPFGRGSTWRSLAGSWRPAGWTGLSPASIKERRACQKKMAETGGARI